MSTHVSYVCTFLPAFLSYVLWLLWHNSHFYGFLWKINVIWSCNRSCNQSTMYSTVNCNVNSVVDIVCGTQGTASLKIQRRPDARWVIQTPIVVLCISGIYNTSQPTSVLHCKFTQQPLSSNEHLLKHSNHPSIAHGSGTELLPSTIQHRISTWFSWGQHRSPVIRGLTSGNSLGFPASLPHRGLGIPWRWVTHTRMSHPRHLISNRGRKG